jgi:hypothetical protein
MPLFFISERERERERQDCIKSYKINELEHSQKRGKKREGWLESEGRQRLRSEAGSYGGQVSPQCHRMV